jgi:hypothetical protein
VKHEHEGIETLPPASTGRRGIAATTLSGSRAKSPAGPYGKVTSGR